MTDRPQDPREWLSREARERIRRAYAKAELIRLKAIAKEGHEGGAAWLESAQFVLRALAEEYLAAGIDDARYRYAMKDEVEAAAYSLCSLTQIASC